MKPDLSLARAETAIPDCQVSLAKWVEIIEATDCATRARFDTDAAMRAAFLGGDA